MSRYDSRLTDHILMSAHENSIETAETLTDSLGDTDLCDPGGLMAMDVATATHRGHVRSVNEDHYLVMRFGRSLENVSTNLDRTILKRNHALTGYGLIVADGLSGAAGGLVASRTALTKLIELIIETPDWIMGIEHHGKTEAVLARMSERFFRIDEALKQQADQDPSLNGMGTTLTVAATLLDDLVIGHIGDSRAYLFRRNLLRQLTRDHTVAQELINAGVSEAHPAARSTRHVLTAALGSLGTRVTPEVKRLQLRPHDQLLLCTDGLTKMIDDRMIASALNNARSAAKACDDLITLALAAGGSDNITVILARFCACS